MMSAVEGSRRVTCEDIRLDTGGGSVFGSLTLPEDFLGIVLFIHDSHASRYCVRNRLVAESLHQRRIGTLMIDLLTPDEERIDFDVAHQRYDIELLRLRTLMATDWLCEHRSISDLKLAYLGTGAGSAAALAAAAQRPDLAAVVSRSGRPELARRALRQVRAATLLIVGNLDFSILPLNREAFSQLQQARRKELSLVANATHLFEEPGALEEASRLAGDWFVRHF